MLNEFETIDVQTGETSIFVRRMGAGSPILLLHGFPETNLMWREVGLILAERHTVICADLRGYGRSSCPPSTDDHAPYSKRTMARDMVDVMSQLGFSRFAVAGHDRGGRVAYRLALDHPHRIDRLAVLDILPVAEMWDRADARFVRAFWPWSLLAQPSPLPEKLISAAPEAVVDDALECWGSTASNFPPEVRQAYVEALRDPVRVHAICEEYRAAATLDREHDTEDRECACRIGCPVLVLWSAGSAMDTWYASEGGPLAIWKKWATDVEGCPVAGGHFFPEEHPALTADMLSRFLSRRH